MVHRLVILPNLAGSSCVDVLSCLVLQDEGAHNQRHHKTKGVFTSYQDRAIDLKMDSKSNKKATP
jgi:hypothetical protein